jgi:hypothetical protein
MTNLSKTEARATCPLRDPQMIRRGEITVAMDASRAEEMVYASFDGGRTWDGTVFQTASFHHLLNEATVREVRNWFKRQAG